MNQDSVFKQHICTPVQSLLYRNIYKIHVYTSYIPSLILLILMITETHETKNMHAGNPKKNPCVNILLNITVDGIYYYNLQTHFSASKMNTKEEDLNKSILECSGNIDTLRSIIPLTDPPRKNRKTHVQECLLKIPNCCCCFVHFQYLCRINQIVEKKNTKKLLMPCLVF